MRYTGAMLNAPLRSIRRRAPAAHGAVVVHGHSIAYAPEATANRIAIDTGAYVTGHLTALVLDGESQRFMST